MEQSIPTRPWMLLVAVAGIALCLAAVALLASGSQGRGVAPNGGRTHEPTPAVQQQQQQQQPHNHLEVEAETQAASPTARELGLYTQVTTLAAGDASPLDCKITWTPVGACSGNCTGALQQEVANITQEPTNGGAPCDAAPGDTRYVPCASGAPCLCFASDLIGGGPNGAYFDAGTVVTCGACDGMSSGSKCFLACSPDAVAGGAAGAAPPTLSGDTSLTCVAGQWSLPAQVPSCSPAAVPCPAIAEDGSRGHLPNSICIGATANDACSIYCKPGFHLVIPGDTPYATAHTAVCLLGGTWDRVPACACDVGCGTDGLCPAPATGPPLFRPSRALSPGYARGDLVTFANQVFMLVASSAVGADNKAIAPDPTDANQLVWLRTSVLPS